MIDVTHMTPEEVFERTRKASRLEALLRTERDIARRAAGGIQGRNPMYSRLFFDRFNSFNNPGTIELRMVQMPYPCDAEMIDGYRVVPAPGQEEEEHHLLKEVHEKHLEILLAKYKVETERFVSMADYAAISFPPIQKKMLDLALYERWHTEHGAKQAIMYVRFPHDDRLRKVSVDLYLGKVGDVEDTDINAEKIGMLQRRRILKEGRDTKSTVLYVHHPNALISGEDLVAHASLRLIKDYDIEWEGSAEARDTIKRMIRSRSSIPVDDPSYEPDVRYVRDTRKKAEEPVVEELSC